MRVGERVIWWRSKAGAYRPLPVDAIVMRFGKRRVQIYAGVPGDRVRLRFVDPWNLRRRTLQNVYAAELAIKREEERCQRRRNEGRGSAGG